MKRKEVKQLLKNRTRDDIIIKEHITVDRAFRQIPEILIIENILNPANLIRIKDEEAKRLNHYKFSLWFKISGNKTLKLIIELNKKVHIITAVMIKEKWQRKVLKWKR